MPADASVDMIATLVGFDTVSSRSNLALIDFVRDYLAGLGVTATLVRNPAGDKANLYATIGPAVPGGVVLSGHTDVVPVTDQDWRTDPFSLVARDGRLYGRGTADMKSFIAVALAMVPEMLAAGLRRPIHLALSYDEEVGCKGAPAMIERLQAELPPPAAVIIGEPTEMRLVTAHKGIACYQTTVTGHEAHSSQTHRGVSAVMTAAELVTWLAERARALARAADTDGGFTPPYATIHVGTIQGGTAANIISRHCRFVWDVRCLPGEDPNDLRAAFDAHVATAVLPAMRAVSADCTIETRTLSLAPPLRPVPGSAAEALVRALTGDNDSFAVPYATEGGQFQQAGFATVVCGPGAIDQAHQPNEYITLDQVVAASAFLRRLIAELRR